MQKHWNKCGDCQEAENTDRNIQSEKEHGEAGKRRQKSQGLLPRAHLSKSVVEASGFHCLLYRAETETWNLCAMVLTVSQ